MGSCIQTPNCPWMTQIVKERRKLSHKFQTFSWLKSSVDDSIRTQKTISKLHTRISFQITYFCHPTKRENPTKRQFTTKKSFEVSYFIGFPTFFLANKRILKNSEKKRDRSDRKSAPSDRVEVFISVSSEYRHKTLLRLKIRNGTLTKF